MRRILFIISAILLFGGASLAQFLPMPTVLRGKGDLMRLPARLQKAITEQYRKLTKQEQETLRPADSLQTEYASFLRQPNTGLTKLAADLKCAENTKIVVAKPACLNFTMPGAGSSFSFRTENYSIQRLADISYTDGGFQATGVLTQGMFVQIGDVPLEEVTLQTRGMKFLLEYAPPLAFEDAGKSSKQMMSGIKSEGFLYRRGLKLYGNSTYLLRSVAYNGRFNRVVEGITYNEFDFDKRRDVIVARDENESVTILWKKLSEKDAPRLIQAD